VIPLAASSSSTSAWDQPGTLGFLVVFGMGVVLYFVFRSMSRHLRKVNQAARVQAAAEEAAAARAPAAAEEAAAARGASADGTVTLSDGTVITSPSGNGSSPAS
jgi:hypothetical protein